MIGTFREKVETFGQSEVERDTILVPITVLRYFTPVERIDPMYVQVRTPQEVERVARRVKEILASRHRAGASYRVETLTAILDAAKNISLILSLVLVLVSTITLVISGIGIMNIMLVTGYGADARDRRAAGSGRIQARDCDAVSDRGDARESLGRSHRDRRGGRDSPQRTVVRGRENSDLASGGGGGVFCIVPGGPGVRDFAGESRRGAESD